MTQSNPNQQEISELEQAIAKLSSGQEWWERAWVKPVIGLALGGAFVAFGGVDAVNQRMAEQQVNQSRIRQSHSELQELRQSEEILQARHEIAITRLDEGVFVMAENNMTKIAFLSPTLRVVDRNTKQPLGAGRIVVDPHACTGVIGGDGYIENIACARLSREFHDKWLSERLGATHAGVYTNGAAE